MLKGKEKLLKEFGAWRWLPCLLERSSVKTSSFLTQRQKSIVSDERGNEQVRQHKNSHSERACLCMSSKEVQPKLEPCFSKEVHGTSASVSLGACWKNADSPAPPQTYCIRIHILTGLPGHAMHSKFNPRIFKAVATLSPPFLHSPSFHSPPLHLSSSSFLNSQNKLCMKIGNYLSPLGPNSNMQMHLFLVLIQNTNQLQSINVWTKQLHWAPRETAGQDSFPTQSIFMSFI